MEFSFWKRSNSSEIVPLNWRSRLLNPDEVVLIYKLKKFNTMNCCLIFWWISTIDLNSLQFMYYSVLNFCANYVMLFMIRLAAFYWQPIFSVLKSNNNGFCWIFEVLDMLREKLKFLLKLVIFIVHERGY